VARNPIHSFEVVLPRRATPQSRYPAAPRATTQQKTSAGNGQLGADSSPRTQQQLLPLLLVLLQATAAATTTTVILMPKAATTEEMEGDHDDIDSTSDDNAADGDGGGKVGDGSTTGLLPAAAGRRCSNAAASATVGHKRPVRRGRPGTLPPFQFAREGTIVRCYKSHITIMYQCILLVYLSIALFRTSKRMKYQISAPNMYRCTLCRSRDSFWHHCCNNTW
jgi:hypothetical protein